MLSAQGRERAKEAGELVTRTWRMCRTLKAPYKGGDPAAGSPTPTLLRLHPNHRPYLRHLRPCRSLSDFWYSRLSRCDGRCVQGPGTHSAAPADLRLLAIPTSCRRVAACNPN